MSTENFNFGEDFIKAVKALVDALSYVDEFDAHTFMSSVTSYSLLYHAY